MGAAPGRVALPFTAPPPQSSAAKPPQAERARATAAPPTVLRAPTRQNPLRARSKPFQVINDGGAEGPIGKVALYARKFIDTDGHYEGTVCNVTGYVALGDFSDVVLKPGKSKTVKVKDVPVPAGPAGWYELSAVLDAACASPITKDMYLQPAFNSFEVV